MDSSNVLALTIFSGVLVGVIVLIIEYNYFQKRAKPKGLVANPTWSNATKKAIQTLTDYRTYHIVDVEIVSTSINKGKAILDLYEIHGRLTPNPVRKRHFIVTIDRTGDILEMKLVDP